MGGSGTSAHAVHALFGHFCYVGGIGDFGDPVVPTLRGVSGDVVTVYATATSYKFLCSMPGSGRSLQKGGNHEESLDCANKMLVPPIPERVTRKLEEANDATSLGDVF